MQPAAFRSSALSGNFSPSVHRSRALPDDPLTPDPVADGYTTDNNLAFHNLYNTSNNDDRPMRGSLATNMACRTLTLAGEAFADRWSANADYGTT